MKRIWEYISVRAEKALSIKQVMSFAMAMLGFFHLCLTVFFSIFGIFPMAAMDFCSVVLYVFCFVQIQRDKSLLYLFNLSYLQIVLHSVIAALLLGTESGFSLYMIAALPIGYYAAYNFNMRKQVINPMCYVVIAGAAFCFLRVASSYMGPFYTYGNKALVSAVYMVNYFVAVIIIVSFISTLLNQIRILENLRSLQNKQLEKLSKTDALTGLANRRSIEERYTQTEALREGYSLVIGDIDDFKAVNDTYGHNVGDAVLKAVAEVFKGTVRSEDIVCRWGGEEFLIFLPKCTGGDAANIAQRILESVRVTDMMTSEKEVFHITMTLGVSTARLGMEFTEVITEADDNLYYGKHHGKNQVV